MRNTELLGQLLDVIEDVGAGQIVDHQDLANLAFAGQQQLSDGLAALDLFTAEAAGSTASGRTG
jgi:hypothetical protein